ncbi:MAG: hypothetical protein QXV84_04470 [Conexivisphaerales archaeon]
MPKSDANNMLAVSTTNGFFILKGPDYKQGNRYLKNESVNNVMMTGKGRFVASTLTDGVYTSDDGEKWKQSSRGLHVRKVWAVEEATRIIEEMLWRRSNHRFDQAYRE